MPCSHDAWAACGGCAGGRAAGTRRRGGMPREHRPHAAPGGSRATPWCAHGSWPGGAGGGPLCSGDLSGAPPPCRGRRRGRTTSMSCPPTLKTRRLTRTWRSQARRGAAAGGGSSRGWQGALCREWLAVDWEPCYPPCAWHAVQPPLFRSPARPPLQRRTRRCHSFSFNLQLPLRLKALWVHRCRGGQGAVRPHV